MAGALSSPDPLLPHRVQRALQMTGKSRGIEYRRCHHPLAQALPQLGQAIVVDLGMVWLKLQYRTVRALGFLQVARFVMGDWASRPTDEGCAADSCTPAAGH